jgi:hypothetical protein
MFKSGSLKYPISSNSRVCARPYGLNLLPRITPKNSD